jgi:hypothetical protein
MKSATSGPPAISASSLEKPRMHYSNTGGVTDQAKLDQHKRKMAVIRGPQTQLAAVSRKGIKQDCVVSSEPGATEATGAACVRSRPFTHTLRLSVAGTKYSRKAVHGGSSDLFGGRDASRWTSG